MRPKKPIIVLSRRTHLAHGMVRPLCPGENLPGEPSWLVRMPCYIQPPPLFCGRHQGWICFFTEQQARNLGIHSFEHMGSQKLKKRGQAVIETGFEARGGPATNRYRLGTIFFLRVLPRLSLSLPHRMAYRGETAASCSCSMRTGGMPAGTIHTRISRNPLCPLPQTTHTQGSSLACASQQYLTPPGTWSSPPSVSCPRNTGPPLQYIHSTTPQPSRSNAW